MVAFFSLGLALLAAFAAATPIEKRNSPLKVELAPTSENAVVQATITNTGSSDLRVLKPGSILSDAPIRKLEVSAGESALEFKGITMSYALNKFTPDDYVTIPAGKSVTTTVELAGIYDLSSADSYSVSATGAFQTTHDTGSEVSITSLSGPAVIEFESNKLDLKVDRAAAAKVEPLAQKLSKRVVLAGCSGSRLTATQTALSNTVRRAQAAYSAALSGSATKFNEYFKTTSSTTRSNVASRFNAIASAASTTNSGRVTYYCTDPYGYCGSNVLAWTLPSSNIMANCDIYYTYLPASTGSCHAQDQWSTTLHEMTHAPGVFSPGTDDNAYGYSACMGLSASAALNNADTYALYANAIYLGC
ncbi:deuterolysin metalloprotease family protein [Pyronema omphalodes]|nr:deuterolysin metalloprotease family protein [Pyronema omphalodes]